LKILNNKPVITRQS